MKMMTTMVLIQRMTRTVKMHKKLVIWPVIEVTFFYLIEFLLVFIDIVELPEYYCIEDDGDDDDGDDDEDGQDG